MYLSRQKIKLERKKEKGGELDAAQHFTFPNTFLYHSFHCSKDVMPRPSKIMHSIFAVEIFYYYYYYLTGKKSIPLKKEKSTKESGSAL